MPEDMRAIGVTGGSGAGKSTFTRALVGLLGHGSVAVLHQDAYYRDLSHLPLGERAERNFDAPEAVDLDLFTRHLSELLRGRPVRPPRYDMATHARRGEGREVRPAGVVVAEGTLLAAAPALLSLLTALVYVDLPEEDRLARRLRRDTKERGRSAESVREQWAATVLPMHRRHVAPARARADFVVSGAESATAAAERVARALSLISR